MKKVAFIIILIFTFSFSSQAQKGHKYREGKGMTIAQKTDLEVKKMTLKLDLTEEQQQQIKPLLFEKIAQKEEMYKKRKAIKEHREKGEKLSADERFKIKSHHLDQMIAFKADMKRILNEKQYQKFERIATRKRHKKKQRYAQHIKKSEDN
ncbi:hypothetical protein ACE1MK_07005 [Tenacibaculum maritimum]|uniref:hypothetical protein n=1 Tax=Tenacibaculum maritimum TaxID=107401 RepID=UPI0012E695E7|nr:hypothetical protein [Tenacibaculum maritimum]MCD9581748.1 hypothetical protein [Tenacibaculum maritimum]MCD9635811.1 hypothetical protein [Tenacibaculum maritimum]CAA0164982.1 conserved exported hypothetical protein [Tenacibaculum maritimum]CAA0173935.1 conserved exported hypothetical protein [Tenacibaculum maritimum]